MKRLISFFSISILLIGITNEVYAREIWERVWTPDSTQEIYDEFTDLDRESKFKLIQRTAIYYHVVGEKQFLIDLNQKPRSLYESLTRTYMHYANAVSCKRDMFLTHPIVKKIVGKKGMFTGFKDTKGLSIGLSFCSRIKTHPKGAAVKIDLFSAGVTGTMQQYFVGIKVPGTDVIMTTYFNIPDKSVEEVEAMMMNWQLPTYNRLYEQKEKK